MSQPLAKIGHNQGPITAPSEEDFLVHLRVTYPQVETDRDRLLKSAASFPASYDDESTAGEVQELIKAMRAHRSAWSAARSQEKTPWQALADTAYNFFKRPEDAIETSMKALLAGHTSFAERKRVRAQVAAEADAKAKREEAERLKREAAAAEERTRKAQEDERLAREAEAKAREATAKAEKERKEAEERIEKARLEEERQAQLKKEREDKERNQLETWLSEANYLVLQNGQYLENIALLTEEGLIEYENAITVAIQTCRKVLASQVASLGQLDRANKLLHTANQHDEIVAARRKADKESRTREREADEKREAEAKAERDRKRKIDEEAADKARRDREAAEAEAAQAKQRASEARADVRSAQAEQRAAVKEQSVAGKDAKVLGKIAEKTETKASRMEAKAEDANAADLSRTRGDYGSVGSLSGRYIARVVSYELVDLAELRPYLNENAIDAAITKWQRDHQKAWNDDAVSTALAGVIFEWHSESRIA